MGLAESARRGVGHVIGADHQGDVGLRKLPVDVVHTYQPVVRDIRFREQKRSYMGAADGKECCMNITGRPWHRRWLNCV